MPDTLTGKELRLYFPFGFPTSLDAGWRFDLLPLVAAADPALTWQSPGEVRRLAHRVNRKRSQVSFQRDPMSAEQLMTLGLITDALRFVATRYCLQQNPGALNDGLDRAATRLGRDAVRDLPAAFARLFPPRDLVRRQPESPPESEELARAARDFLQGTAAGLANRDRTVIETILLYLSMRNPATRPLRELFDDADLQKRSPYVPFVVGLEEFFAEQPPLDRQGMTLFSCLRAPMHASPDSLEGQLHFVRDHWAEFLPRPLLAQLTLTLDIWREDQQLRGLGPGPTPVLEFRESAFGSDLGYLEPEAFTADKDWMSNVVLIAKNAHVWLDQLSKRYGRSIRLLGDIPDAELDRLAAWGFRGLWLIGLWERSPASQKIKQYMGNPEAAASAYSLHDYRVAENLGGDEALADLRSRALTRGIRLASDMVPNHMGIDSSWVVEHPDWFIQTEQPPYPWYLFSGGDLSSDPRVGLFIENGYWEHRDAAVVFRRVDNRTGQVRYIYHGNDGTSMPWNDTAQLNFLLPEVREAVIRTILHVASQFPIIRFDAAMTLAKRHYQRLWFPLPGEAGAIPSRAEHGLSRQEFDAAFGPEFWREVVDRLAAEQPDTLLLAEAFWLMEGYFVRTLGMHRVYNSAFMNMLKMEENQKYRQTVKNVLEFSPEVLKRFVNFMNNPDERTAIEQYGKGDKYYGVAVLMVTMPGLPMFGHGQVEGLSERYGMEYRKAYWDEQVDSHMVGRHEQEIFPLMRRRQLFSGAQNFALFDFVRPDGSVDENVFAFTNRSDTERALIIYNNAYERTGGRIGTSTAINVGTVDEPVLECFSVADALALDVSEGCFYSFRDHRTGLEYLRSGREIADQGLAAELAGYQYHAFLDFRELRDSDGGWAELARRLGDRPVPSVAASRRELELEPVLLPFGKAVRAAVLLALNPTSAGSRELFEDTLADFARAVAVFLPAGSREDTTPLLVEAAAELDLVLDPESSLGSSGLDAGTTADLLIPLDLAGDPARLRPALAGIILHLAGRFAAAGDATDPRALAAARAWDWFLAPRIRAAFAAEAGDEQAAHLEARLAVCALAWAGVLCPDPPESLGEKVQSLLADQDVREYLAVNEHEGVLWLNRERLASLVQAFVPAAVMKLASAGRLDERSAALVLASAREIQVAAEETGFRVTEMIDLLRVSESKRR